MLSIEFFMMIVGLFAFVMGLCVMVTYLEKKHTEKEYDERQKLVHGKAYRLAFIAGIGYFVCVTIWQMFVAEQGKYTQDIYFVIFLGIWIQLMLFNTYCLLHNAALPLSEKRSWAIGTCLLFSGYYFIKYAVYGPELNRAALKQIPLMMCVGFAYIALLHIIQYFRTRNEVE